MKPFLDFYIKDISISPGLRKPSNKTDFKPDDCLKLSLCLLGGKKKTKQEKIKTFRIPTSVHCLGKRPKGKQIICLWFKSGQNAFKHKYKTINKSQGTKAVHLTHINKAMIS